MSYASQHTAIHQRFKSQWGSTTPVAWPNVDFVPPKDGEAWVRFTVADAGAAQRSMGDPGNNIFRYAGVVTISIFTRAGDGDGLATDLVDKAEAIFRSWQDTSTGIRFRVPPFARPAGNSGIWYQTNVIAHFERDTLL